MKSTTHLLAGALVALLPALALTVPGVASATAIQLTAPSATFSNDQGGYAVTYPDPNEVRWGDPTGNTPKSGLRFDMFGAPLDTNTGTAFDLGTLTHFNYEISLPGISTVDLAFQFDIAGATPSTLNFLYTLGVQETPNQAAGCANQPITPGNYCPDIISFPQLGGTTQFTLGGKVYTLNLLGFGPDAHHLTTDFITQEGLVNTTDLWAEISEPRNPVPEPGSLFMMGLGLFGMLGFLGLRRKYGTHEA